WPDEAAVGHGRGPFDAGVIHAEGLRHDCSIRRISPLGATLSGEVPLAAGKEIAVELATGQRPAAVVDWVAGGEAGAVFKQPIDLIALINRNLISQPAERRAMPRVELRCRLHLKWGASIASAMLRNISAKGLQVEGEELPPRGTFVSIFVDGLNVPAGEVVWQKDLLAGIELFEDLSWSSLIPWIRSIGRQAA
ncbi:MAG TPA: PilZ domain-containing protein, partial [Sphingomicrobium sp.]|nr:PilZ domain-containing protein [Sphingomicrobium sp.]